MTSTPIAKMVREMIAKGVDPDVIELAVATAEMTATPIVSGGSPVDTAAEKRRAYDRERKAKDREIHRMSGGNPRTSENASLSKEVSIDNRKEERVARQASVRGQRLPDDWQPTPQDQATSIEVIGADRARAELEKFRDHWKQQPGSKGVKLDWNAAWRNWIRRASEYLTRGTANGRRTVHDAAKDLTRTLERLAEFDEPAPGGVRIEEGGTAFRLLPPR